MLFELYNNLTKKTYEFEVIDDETSRLFYHFHITLPKGIKDGEYNYYLKDGDKILASGLAQVGDYTPSKITYNKTDNGYVQYD